MKMKLGDIEIDTERGISFEDSQRNRSHPALFDPAAAFGAARFSGPLSILAIIAILCTLTLLFWETPLLLLALAIPTTLCLTMLVWTRNLSTADPPVNQESHSALARLRGQRLLEFFDGGAMTVQALCMASGWQEIAVLEGLAWLVSQGVLEEDVDIESAAFCYRESTSVMFEFEKDQDRLRSVEERLAHHHEHASPRH